MSGIDNQIARFIEDIQRKDFENIYKNYCSDKALETAYKKNTNIFGKNDWKNHLLGLYSCQPTDETSMKSYETKAFLELSARVEHFLKNNISVLDTSSIEEYKRNLNLCKDITIPCTNITSSFQSTETIIELFFLNIYAAYQIIGCYRSESIIEIDLKDSSLITAFSSKFEQKICILPCTLKRFCDKKRKFNDDKQYFDKNILDDHNHNILYYLENIEKYLIEILEKFEEFLRNCNNMFFTLMCRWLEIFLRSLLLIPSEGLINTLSSYLNDDQKSEAADIAKSLNDVIMRNSLYKSLTETSNATSYLMITIENCFKKYEPILNFGKEIIKVKTSKDKEINDEIDRVKNKIGNVLMFGYDKSISFSDDDYKFSELIDKHIFSNSVRNKQTVAVLIEKTIDLILK